MHRLDGMAKGSLHRDVLSDNIRDALGKSRCCKWAAGVQTQCAGLGMTPPFSGGRGHNIDGLALCKAMLAQHMSVWGCKCHLVVLLLGVPSFAPISGGLHGWTR